jgi:hypothetical protein
MIGQDAGKAQDAAKASKLSRLVYWEDAIQAPVRRYGPLVFTSVLLDTLLELMGEKHPIHDNDSFAKTTARKRRIVPGGFIHSITSGWAVQHGSPAAIVGLRSVHWDFVKPLYPDVPFYFSNETESYEEFDDRLGLIKTIRRVFDEEGRAYAIGRMRMVMQRRPAAESTSVEAAASDTAQ